MEEFKEEHAKKLLSKEWLVKTDSAKAIPYLFKCNFSSTDLTCVVLITDTKSVWAEVLNSKQMARRWRACNPQSPEPFSKASAEDTWREKTMELLSKAHTIGGIAELSFEIVDSHYSDLAIELECETLKWRWETCFLGHKLSSEIISKHLIFPLISLNHMIFSSTEVVGELSDADVEKAVDKLGRTARRTVDTHIKNALAKPRIATSIRRMTATFNFVADPPRVISVAENPDLQFEQVEPEESTSSKVSRDLIEKKRDITPAPARETTVDAREHIEAKAIQSDSATEESEADDPMEISRPGLHQNVTGSLEGGQRSGTPESLTTRNPPVSKPLPPTSDSDSSPHRPTKKAKSKALTSDDDSDEDGAKKSSQPKSGHSAGSGVKRGGTRQPIKRGGKRF